jgi:hypothetical protein
MAQEAKQGEKMTELYSPSERGATQRSLTVSQVTHSESTMMSERGTEQSV